MIATDKQVSFLLRLLVEKNPEADLRKAEDWARGATRKAVSDQIDRMVKAPRPAPINEAPAVVEAGFYLLDGNIVKVQQSKTSLKLYAKTLILSTKRFEYAPGVVHKLSPESKLTLEQAAKFGHATGVCAICSRDLSDPVSVERGIGPVCAKRFA